MTNPCQDPTPEQEAIYSLNQDIAYLKEQLREVVALIKKIDDWSGTYYSDPIHQVTAFGAIAVKVEAFIDQNADIVKELNNANK